MPQSIHFFAICNITENISLSVFSLDFHTLRTVCKNAIKTITIASSSHPWTVLRAAELISWYESDNYKQLIENKSSIECSVCHQQIPADSKKCPFCGNEEL